jgi:hypothetical protein
MGMQNWSKMGDIFRINNLSSSEKISRFVPEMFKFVGFLQNSDFKGF